MSTNVRTALIEAELEALFRVGQVLSRSFNLKETLQNVLHVLHDYTGMHYGMVALSDDYGALSICAVYSGNKHAPNTVQYKPGEGVIGLILETAKPFILERLADEPRFLGRLGLYDPNLPFIGMPIIIGKEKPLGVFTAQPNINNDGLLEERVRFMKMVTQLVAQMVRLANQIQRERRDLTDQRDHLRRVVSNNYGLKNIIGHSTAMKRVFELVRQVAKWDTTVLIRGESGTGKELIAHAIHYNSPRHNNDFIKLNCASLPENLLESELFGHEKGAFTGATQQYKGRFERANKGTLFLDEIGDISPKFQAKLLRVLQEGELERVGGNRTIKVDVRFITATHVDLETQVKAGKFREDLYYRLNVIPITLPPLRERIEDIPELSKFLIKKLAKKQNRKLNITENAIRILMRHNWSGNVRELENCLERAAIMSEDNCIDTEIKKSFKNENIQETNFNDITLEEPERVIAALQQAGWVQAKAARLLNMTPRQIAYRIKIYNIKLQNF
ncbi:nif-specific transcriptional activator NifA [Candidatus Marithrix sp. Canyon 246]|uniref:nif-specific transcriptional activator NifA n=1 Tax=Candidatus Marithrix sp. Canyon 246 TaxID=1827136 RepID=UPI000849FE51|nr:nif-specific transcriptional activator NifA [Candidatus Marithrix sp. Canyon 246]